MHDRPLRLGAFGVGRMGQVHLEHLIALHQAGAIEPSDKAYQRGVIYLLNTQLADGSWHVKSRALKFQPYFQSGFPYGHDQWISSAGTAWAATALALSLPGAPK